MKEMENGEEKNEEVIAEKSRASAYVYLAVAMIGLLAAAAGVFLVAGAVKSAGATVKIVGWCLLGAGLAALAVFGALFLKQLYSPFALVKLKNGKLVFPDGKSVKPGELTAVERNKKARKITVTVGGEKIEIGGLGNCEKAYKKLCVLTGNPIEE